MLTNIRRYIIPVYISPRNLLSYSYGIPNIPNCKRPLNRIPEKGRIITQLPLRMLLGLGVLA